MNCPVCQSQSIRPLPPFYLYENIRYDLYRCCDCLVQFIHPFPTEATLERMYGKEYFESDFHCGHSGHSAFEHQETQFPDWYSSINLHPPARVLEIGCATGYQLKVFQIAGYDCTGIEISKEAAEYARTKNNLHVLPGSVIQTDLDENAFDVIYLHDVFEHLTNPAETLQKISLWLKPSAVVVIVIPTQTNTLFSRFGLLLYSMISKRIQVHLPPYHLFEYRPVSIRRLLENQGFHNIRLYPSIMKPSEIALRGSLFQRIIKKMFHYPNYLMTRITGLCGDRLTVIVQKPDDGKINFNGK